MKYTVSPFPIHSFSFKFVAGFVAFVGFLLFGWLKISAEVLPITNLDYASQVQGSLFILALGLFLMAFSKEKIEDERVQQIRAVAMRNGFQTLATLLLVFNMRGIENGVFEIPYTLELLIVCFLLYHLFFHASLYFNLNVSAVEQTVNERMRIKPMYYLVFILVQIIGLALLFWFR